MLFLNPEKKFNIKKFYKKNVLRLFIALCFWSILYGLYGVLTKTGEGSSWTIFSIVGPIFYKRLPWYHLWFMYMILGLYFVVPIIRVFIQAANKKDLKYVILLFFIVNTISFWNEFMPDLNFSIPVITSYLGYFILGHYLYHYDISEKTRKLIYWLSFASVVFIVLLHIISGASPRTYINATNNPFVIIISAGAFLSFKHSKSKLFNNANIWKQLSILSFGIYLVHDFFIQFIHLDFLPDCSLIVVPIKGVAVILCSLTVTYVIKKIPFLGKYIC